MEEKTEEIKNNNIIDNGNNNIINNKEVDERKKIMSYIVKKYIQCSKKTQEITTNILDSIMCKNKEKLKSLCEDGLPDELPELRSLIWKINIGYLPLDMEKWNEILKSKRASYKLYKNYVFDNLGKELELFKDYEKMKESEKKELDKKTSKLILEEICKDTNRTHTEMSFFLRPIDKDIIFTEEEVIKLYENKRNCNLKNINETYKINIVLTHSDIISRILFIYSKFEPNISYIQGMNEILAPIYYCFNLHSSDEVESVDDIEADTFYTYYALMSKLKNLFDKNEDKKDDGINGKAKRLKEMLKIIDNILYNHLEESNFDFSILVYKWISLLFTQNYEMIDVIRLWDYLLSNENIFINCYYFSLAIILMKKEEVLNIDKINNLYKIFQNIRDLNIENIIFNAKLISEKCGKKCLDILKY